MDFDDSYKTIKLIQKEIFELVCFWKSSYGWAPIEAAELLSRSMLEWMESLANALDLWNRKLTDGELILAWTNIGAIVECLMKLFLSIYYEDYKKDIDAIKKKGLLIEPDSLNLEKLRTFFCKKIWLPNEDWNEWILFIQHRRNSIHAFKSREIGDTKELLENIQKLHRFINNISFRLPPTPENDE